MSNIKINSTPSRAQYTATSGQTEFSVPFPWNTDSDLKVYQRIAGSTADDATDLLTITTEYTLTGAGVADGGTMTLVTGATTGDIVTIIGDDPVDRDTIFNTPTKLTNTALNTQFNNLVIYIKQLETRMDQLMLSYNNNEALDTGYLVDNVLPILAASEVWRKNDGDTAMETATLPANPVGSVGGDFTTDNLLTKTNTAGGLNNIEESGITISDSDDMTGVNSIEVNGVTYPTNTPAAGEVIKATSPTAAEWSSGSDGDVDGPASATNNAIARFDGTTGKLLQNSSVTISDVDAMAGLTSLTVDNITIDGNSITVDDTDGDLNINANGTGDVLFNGSDVICGDPGTEGSGISIDGVTYDSALKVSDLGGTNVAQFIIHRHSTTLAPLIVGARTNSNTSSHSIVTDGQALFQMYGSGWDGAAYQLGASISYEVDGTPGANDMPGRIVFNTTPDGAKVPVEAFRLSQDQAALFAGAVTLADLTASRAVTTDGSKVLTSSATTATELGYVNGVTSSIQGQFDALSVATGSARLSTQVASSAAYTVTYDNGTAGVGATLTNAGAQAAFAADGVTLSANDRVLIKDQAAALQNGIYSVTTVGDGSTNWVLTRATDFDTPSLLTEGTFAYVENGDTQARRGYMQVADVTTIGVDSITFGLLDIDSVRQNGATVFAADAGASDTYVITLSPVPAAYTTGMLVNFSANTINTGAATLNVNGLGAKTIKKLHDQDLADGDIEAGQIVTVIYDGTNFQMQSQVATSGGSGIFTESYTSSNQTITSAGSLTLAHSLSTEPKLIMVQVECQTAENNYSIGDKLFIPVGGSNLLSNANAGASVVPDSTNLNIRYGSETACIDALNKTTGARVALTNANWQAIFHAWA